VSVCAWFCSVAPQFSAIFLTCWQRLRHKERKELSIGSSLAGINLESGHLRFDRTLSILRGEGAGRPFARRFADFHMTFVNAFDRPVSMVLSSFTVLFRALHASRNSRQLQLPEMLAYFLR
jgi:hypothetical protein